MNIIEAVRLCAFAPSSSPLELLGGMVSPGSMNEMNNPASELLSLDAMIFRHLGPLPVHELFDGGLKRRQRNPDLFHCITIANRDFVIRQRFFITYCLDVYGNAKRRAHFVLAPIEAPDGCGVIVDGQPSFA